MRKQVKALLARCARVAQAIEDGEIHLPDAGEGNVWTLYDSGSSINVSDHSKQFPGARVEHTANAGTFYSATGQPFTSKGKQIVDRWFKTTERQA